MSFANKQTVPIDECRRDVHRFDGASDVVEYVSPDGRPVDAPRKAASHRVLFRHTLEVMVAFAAGFVTAVAVILI